MTTKISTLPVLDTVTDATIIPVVEGGATKRITGAALKTYTGSSGGAGTSATLTGVETLTNKRITPRVSSTDTITSPLAWNSDNYDQYELTALANNLTISADSGTPTSGQRILFRIKDGGIVRLLTWATGSSKSFRAVGVTLPTTTVSAGKTLYVGCVYNSTDSRWDAIAVSQEA